MNGTRKGRRAETQRRITERLYRHEQCREGKLYPAHRAQPLALDGRVQCLTCGRTMGEA